MFTLEGGGGVPGSSSSLTSRIPFNISSHFPFLPRSSRDTILKLNSPSSAAFFADDKSRALAARISSFDAERAEWIAVKAPFRAAVGSVARICEADLAALAASAGRALVKDIVSLISSR